MIISSRWQPSAWGMGQRSTLAIAVGGDFHLVLEVFQNLQVENKVTIHLSMTLVIHLELKGQLAFLLHFVACISHVFIIAGS